MHVFPSDVQFSIPERFTDPFRYQAHPSVRKAAELLMQRIAGSAELSAYFAEGKMLGVLVVADRSGQLGYLSAFSGNVSGQSRLEGFVPPIFDLLDPSGYFKIKEAEISALNNRIGTMEKGPVLLQLREELSEAGQCRDAGISQLKARMAISKKKRDAVRDTVSDPGRMAELIRESQFEKAELRRLKLGWDQKISSIKKEIGAIEEEINGMKRCRAEMSDELQKWIFSRYIVHNALGESESIGRIFKERGMVPPGGTGECAAPKLLEYAFRKGLRPLAMGEFWYGAPSTTAIRVQGHFYPSCTSKCGPLLGFMMKGLELDSDISPSSWAPELIYEDEYLAVVSKPAGMPSVPGLDGKESLEEWLSRKYNHRFFSVHRLDMDTSGIMIFAKDPESAIGLQRQFEEHSISKTYMARLSATPEGMILKTGDKGKISLYLNADYDERPRQKVDPQQGKSAITAYEVVSASPEGWIDILFRPVTGRTHQLRVHSAHILGLGHPIAGDLLYGGSPASRLYLHAYEISFRHPATEQLMAFSTLSNIYSGQSIR